MPHLHPVLPLQGPVKVSVADGPVHSMYLLMCRSIGASHTNVPFFLRVQGSVKSLAADATGRHLVTTGTDSQVCVWDLRTFKPLHSYFSRAPAEWCDISQRGMLAVGWGRKVSVWQDALARKQAAPYLSHTLLGGALRDFQFCPYEVGSIICSKLGSAVC